MHIFSYLKRCVIRMLNSHKSAAPSKANLLNKEEMSAISRFSRM